MESVSVTNKVRDILVRYVSQDIVNVANIKRNVYLITVSDYIDINESFLSKFASNMGIIKQAFDKPISRIVFVFDTVPITNTKTSKVYLGLWMDFDVMIARPILICPKCLSPSICLRYEALTYFDTYYFVTGDQLLSQDFSEYEREVDDQPIIPKRIVKLECTNYESECDYVIDLDVQLENEEQIDNPISLVRLINKS